MSPWRVADHVENLGQIDLSAVTIPPLLFATMAREELHLGAVGKSMFDLDHVVCVTLGAVHEPASRLGGGQLYLPDGAFPQPERPMPLGSVLFEQPTDVAGPAPTVLGPVGVPIGAVGAAGAGGFTAFDRLLAEAHGNVLVGGHDTRSLEMGTSEDDEPTQFVFVEFTNGIQEIAIESHRESEESGHVEGEQRGHRTPISQRPSEWRSEPVGVVDTQGVAGKGRLIGEILEPYGPLGVIE